MQTHTSHEICFTALLLLSFAIGCGDLDKNADAGLPSSYSGGYFRVTEVTFTSAGDGS